MEDDIMKKRMLSAILAMSMVMGMSSVTAFAADIDDVANAGQNTFSAENEGYVEPTINVTLPTSGAISLDPFNINQQGQIFSANYKIINNSNVPLAVTIKGAKAVGTEGFAMVDKALKDGSKWAMVSINVTDGLGKATTKLVGASTDGVDVAVATDMAPMGGIVKFSYTGQTADVLSSDLTWTTTDKVTVSNTYSFTIKPFVKYDIKKTMVSSVTAVNYDLYTDVNEDDESTIPADEAAIVATFPATVLGDGKEVPVTWEYVAAGEGDEYDGTAVGTYKFKAVVTDDSIYNVAENVTMPEITVTIADTTPAEGD